jgi:hypothetical protein
MIRALLYLRLTSLANWLRWRVRRLRQPKYLVGAIVGVAYFYFFFFRHVGRVRPGGTHGYGPLAVAPAAADLPTEWLPVALAIGAVILLVVLAFMWIVPTQRAALGFTEAEIAFLFPAPVTRRGLVHFRLISAQLRSLLAGLVMAVISNRWTVLGGNALTHALGWWFVFSTLNLHFTGASFTLTRAADRGTSLVVRRLGILVFIAAIVGTTWWRQPPPPDVGISGAATSMHAVGRWIVGVTNVAPLSWLLYPLRLVLGPFVAADTRSFLAALGPAFLVIGAHYLWVVRTVVSFEDASIAHAEKRSARIAAWRSGGRQLSPKAGRAAPFALRGTGRPEIAFLWKNLLSTWPYFSWRVFVAGAAVVVAGSVWFRLHPAWAGFGTAAGAVAAFAGAYVLVIGPQFARQDLRGDLRKLDILRTYPLAGWQIVAGELLAPAAILTGLVWLTLLIAVLNLDGGTAARTWFTPSVRVAGGIGLALVVPPLALLQLLVPNAAALVFPSWAEATRTRGGGPEVMGQRMIFLFAQLLTMAAVLVPAVLVGGVIIAVVQLFAGPSMAVLAASGPVVAVLFAEVAAGVWWLGRRFEKLDVAEELRA